ncbi:MAG: ATP synthase F1 subunit epsilon [candidate division Zixibacteria bacterium]|nr:ATP synthase F1 subunit epsilon [candidate division Zixibacteria bacterium]
MYKLSVVTQEKVLFEEDVSSLIAPGAQGYLGILTDHAPLITSLVPGKLTIKDTSGNENFYAISGGFLEVSNNRATILADAVEPLEDIDLSRAESALQRARERLQKQEDIDLERARKAKERAENRLKLKKGR